MNFSLTWSSAIVFFLLSLLKGAGLEADEGSVTAFVAMAIQVVSAIGIFWGRYRQGDISLFGLKIK
jgi:hypothetical protein